MTIRMPMIAFLESWQEYCRSKMFEGIKGAAQGSKGRAFFAHFKGVSDSITLQEKVSILQYSVKNVR